MMQAFLRLLWPVCIVALSAGCQKSGTPAKPADAAAPTGQPAGAQPGAQAPASGLPGAAIPPGLPVAPGSPGSSPTGQPAEAPVKPVPAVLPAVVAKVNGEDIQKWEVETALKQAEGTAGGPVPP